MNNVYEQAAKYLQAHDPQLAPVIARVGICTITPHTNYYQDLVESIIGQQLSVKAAATIGGRFKALFGERMPLPEEILSKTTDELRTAGLSNAKANYVHDLARHVVEGSVTFDDLDSLSNEQIITKLTDVKGIGEWTVHMFLMFCMGRTDVLPTGDLGIRSGMRTLYGLDHLPLPAEMRDIAKTYQWHPYESVAAWYVWQFLDNKPKITV